jgi:16S rRNA (uracil1498-N3)-methyltransferase
VATVLGAGTGPHAFVDDAEHPVLADEDRHHLAKALRVRPGDVMTVADGRGAWRPCRFGDELEPVGPIEHVPAPAPALTIAFALVKGERPELIVQKATELGIDRIVPFVAARSVVRPEAGRVDRQVERWRRVAREAAMQSRRAWLPEVAEPVDFSALVALPGVCRADRGGAAPSLERPTVVVGPEGGWTSEEAAAIPVCVGLGPQVLRAETASIAAATLLAALRSGLVRGADGPRDGG